MTLQRWRWRGTAWIVATGLAVAALTVGSADHALRTYAAATDHDVRRVHATLPPSSEAWCDCQVRGEAGSKVLQAVETPYGVNLVAELYRMGMHVNGCPEDTVLSHSAIEMRWEQTERSLMHRVLLPDLLTAPEGTVVERLRRESAELQFDGLTPNPDCAETPEAPQKQRDRAPVRADSADLAGVIAPPSAEDGRA
jgi:hypothetical protein